jgi:hypothetical protein
VRFQTDEIGLLTEAVYDTRSELTRDVLDAIRSGVITGYSTHTQVFEEAETGEVRDGRPVVEVVRAELLEGGLTDDPADPGAVILGIADQHLRNATRVSEDPLEGTSWDEALTYFESVTGVRLADEARDLGRRRENQTRNHIDSVDRIARRLAEVRSSAETACATSRSNGDRSRAFDLGQEAEELDAELRELLLFDNNTLIDVMHRYRIPRRVTPLDRMLGR